MAEPSVAAQTPPLSINSEGQMCACGLSLFVGNQASSQPIFAASARLQPQPQGLLPLASPMALLKIDGPGERVPGMATGFSSFSFPFFHPEKSREI